MLRGFMRRVAAAAVTVLGAALLVTHQGGDAAASSCQSGNYYVVGSAPLKNLITGVSSWNYGYVQLWYSATCNVNWTRMVFNVSGTWFGAATVETVNNAPYGSSGTFGPETVPPSIDIVSPMIDGTPPACSSGDIQNGTTLVVTYKAQVRQANAPNCGG